jgi:hypothetical protein
MLQAGRQPVLPSVGQHAAPRKGRPTHESRTQQFQTSAESRVTCCQDRTEEPAAAGEFQGMQFVLRGDSSCEEHSLTKLETQEWDGMVRVCFNRKNKTLRSVFTTKFVLQTLEDNLRTVFSLQNKPVPDPFPNIKDVIVQCLERTNFNDKRAAKLDLDDFLL